VEQQSTDPGGDAISRDGRGSWAGAGEQVEALKQKLPAVVNPELPGSADCFPHPRLGPMAVCGHLTTQATRAAFLTSPLAYHRLRISSCFYPSGFFWAVFPRIDKPERSKLAIQNFFEQFCVDLTSVDDQGPPLEFSSSFSSSFFSPAVICFGMFVLSMPPCLSFVLAHLRPQDRRSSVLSFPSA
jgi:hypothetical protein